MTASLRVLKAHRASTTVAYRPCTALTRYILWLSSALSAKCAVLVHYATVVLVHPAGSLDPISQEASHHPRLQWPTGQWGQDFRRPVLEKNHEQSASVVQSTASISRP